MAKSFRTTKEYRHWKVAVIKRDKVCVICKTREHRQAHHMNSASYFPDEVYLLSNGVTLCHNCHTNFHTNFKRSFRTKCTKYDFDNFVTLVNYIKTIK